ncbi:MAG: divalent-cation tolerance protein CutA [Candidatus Eisenbacteria bacterium]
MRRPCFQVQTTIDDRERAGELVRSVVERRLAACGQVLGPLESTYWWNGRVETEKEWMCVFKTTAGLAPRLEAFLLEAHPYEVPEIVGFEMGLASPDYTDWIHDETED